MGAEGPFSTFGAYRLTDEKSLIEHELREVRQQLYALRRGTLDAAAQSRSSASFGCSTKLLGQTNDVSSSGWRSSASPTPDRRSRWSSSSSMGARSTSRARVRNYVSIGSAFGAGCEPFFVALGGTGLSARAVPRMRMLANPRG